MSYRRSIAAAAARALAAAVTAPFASAQQQQAAAAGGTGTGADAGPRRPIMSLLDRTPLGKTLDDYNIDIHGHVEAGYTWNFQNPATDQNAAEGPVTLPVQADPSDRAVTVVDELRAGPAGRQPCAAARAARGRSRTRTTVRRVAVGDTYAGDGPHVQ